MKILVDYKAAHLPESTKPEPSKKEKFDEDIQKMQTALYNNDGLAITDIFEQLRSDALAVGASTESTGYSDTSGDSTIGSRDNTTGQRVLQSESDMVTGEIPHGENPSFAPTGVPRRKETNRVIFHHSASGFVDVDTINAWHIERGFVCVGYHYVIRIDGKIEHGRKLQLIGAHARGRNSDSVGVCIVGHLGNNEMEKEQGEACARLYHDLCRVYNKELNIEFHHEECPGKYLNRTEFLESLRNTL